VFEREKELCKGCISVCVCVCVLGRGGMKIVDKHKLIVDKDCLTLLTPNYASTYHGRG
jgi:hypothetical protein